MEDIRIPVPHSDQGVLPVSRSLLLPGWMGWTIGLIVFAILAVLVFCAIAWWAKHRAGRNGP